MERNEYVLNDRGSIWVGSARNNGGIPWMFGQVKKKHSNFALREAVIRIRGGDTVEKQHCCLFNITHNHKLYKDYRCFKTVLHILANSCWNFKYGIRTSQQLVKIVKLLTSRPPPTPISPTTVIVHIDKLSSPPPSRHVRQENENFVAKILYILLKINITT